MSGPALCRLGWHRWRRCEGVTWRHIWGRTYEVLGARQCQRRGCVAYEMTRTEVFL